MTRCPFCAEDIRDAAIVCKHRRRNLPTATPNTVITEQLQQPELREHAPSVPVEHSEPLRGDVLRGTYDRSRSGLRSDLTSMMTWCSAPGITELSEVLPLHRTASLLESARMR